MGTLRGIASRPRWGRAGPGMVVAALLLGPGVETSVAQGFPHRRHAAGITCLVCHLSPSGARLTFEAPRGCRSCHHMEASRRGCARCHPTDRLPVSLSVAVGVAAAGRPGRERPVAFEHRRHASEACLACHVPSLTMAPADSAASCTGCHERHHRDGPQCAACHRTPFIAPAHARPARPHVGCDACHPRAAITSLEPSRRFCLTCHQPAVDHHPVRDCVACHLQLGTEQYRALLLKPRRVP